jgi:CheY-like chemotaxis protein
MARIVVIDDSKLMRNLLRHILEEAGHQVETWEEVAATEAQGRIAQADPDLLLTDYQMPGCNGLTLARMARKAKPDLPVVVLTSTHDPVIMEALKNQAVSRILHKPLQEGELVAAVGALV